MRAPPRATPAPAAPAPAPAPARVRGLERWATRDMVSGARQRYLLSVLWAHGPLNRRALHERTGIRPNTIGLDTAALIDGGLVRELGLLTGRRGRPATPLEVDPQRRRVAGLAILPGYVGVAQLNLLGQPLHNREQACDSDDPRGTLAKARHLLAAAVDPATLAVGVSIAGSVDPATRASLYSSAWPAARAVPLQPLYDLAGRRPLILENHLHAMAARWLLTRGDGNREDVLLVAVEDGQLGAALLIEGRPNRGCVTGANELGHTRFPVATDPCHCGQRGCLERICSTPFLRRRSKRGGTLMQRAAAYDGTDRPLTEVIDLLAMGLANAVSLTRVNRLVLASEMIRHPAFTQALVASVRRQLVIDVADRVHVELWQQTHGSAGETAGWLGLANLFLDGWGDAGDLTNLGSPQERLPGDRTAAGGNGGK